MLTRVVAIEFSRPTDSGRTFPSHLVCEKSNGDAVEVVAKFSAGCDEGVVDLAREVISACLAADLGLPVHSTPTGALLLTRIRSPAAGAPRLSRRLVSGLWRKVKGRGGGELERRPEFLRSPNAARSLAMGRLRLRDVHSHMDCERHVQCRRRHV